MNDLIPWINFPDPTPARRDRAIAAPRSPQASRIPTGGGKVRMVRRDASRGPITRAVGRCVTAWRVMALALRLRREKHWPMRTARIVASYQITGGVA